MSVIVSRLSVFEGTVVGSEVLEEFPIKGQLVAGYGDVGT